MNKVYKWINENYDGPIKKKLIAEAEQLLMKRFQRKRVKEVDY